MRHVLRQIFLSIFVLSLVTACGGGGGGGDSGGGGSGASLTLSASSLSFTAQRFGAQPVPQSFTVRWTGSNVAGFAVGVPPGESVPSWIGVSTQGNNSPVTVTVTIYQAGLAAGSYSQTLRVVTGDANANPISSRDIEIQLTVSDPFSVSETSLVFRDLIGDAIPPRTDSFQVTGANVDFTATADQPWVVLSPASGAAPQFVDVNIDESGLTIGTYTATITVTNNNDPSETATINVTLELLAPEVRLSFPILNFGVTNGGGAAVVTVNFSLSNNQSTAWTVSASDPWITLDNTSFTEPGFVLVSVDPSQGPLASGNYSGSVTFETIYQGVPITRTETVNLFLTPPTLTTSNTGFDFQGGSQSDFVAQTLSFDVDVASGTWSVDFSYDNGSDWMQAIPASGDIGIDTVDVELRPVTAGLTEDSYSGTVTITFAVNGDVITQSLPVTLALEPRRLFVPDNGVALTSTPTVTKLTHTVRVKDNRGVATAWNASSDQPWLTATPSGTTDGDLVLTADPAGLAAETIHYANVTVTSTDSAIVNSGDEVIKVGLYVTDTAPVTPIQIDITAAGSLTVAGLVEDPIRPYVYITDATAGIEVYNIYTGALVDEIPGAGTNLRFLAVSSDGDTLYAVDHVLDGIVTVDLTQPTLSANAPWTNPAWECGCQNTRWESQLRYTRLNGREVLIGGDNTIIDATNGSMLYSEANVSFLLPRVFTAVPESGGILFSGSTGTSSSTLRRQVLKYDTIGDVFSMTEERLGGAIGSVRGLTTDPEGDLIYRACWYPLDEIEIIDGQSLSALSRVTNGTNGGALYGPDDLVYCARYYSEGSAPGSPDIWAVSPTTRAVVGEYNVLGEVEARRYAISADGLRLIVRSASQGRLTFFTIQ